MSNEDREALAVELRKVYMRTPSIRGMDAPRWVAVADAAIAALHLPGQGNLTLRDHARSLTGESDEGLTELGGFQGERVTDEMVERAALVLHGEFCLTRVYEGQGNEERIVGITPFDWLSEESRTHYRATARAALTAALGVSE